MRVAALTDADASAYRDLMLEAYEQAADAFTTTAQERSAEPMSWWVKRIGSPSALSCCFGAWEGAELVGTVALQFAAKPKTRHGVLVIGMYVKPRLRGKGIGRLLMRAAIEAAAARPEVQVLTLTLTEGNEAALHLYKSMGFTAWGVEPLAILTSDGLKGKVHMAMPLARAGAAV